MKIDFSKKSKSEFGSGMTYVAGLVGIWGLVSTAVYWIIDHVTIVKDDSEEES